MRKTYRKILAMLLAAACVSASIPASAYEEETALTSEASTGLSETVDSDSENEGVSETLTETASQTNDTAAAEAEVQAELSVTSETETQAELSVASETEAQADISTYTEAAQTEDASLTDTSMLTNEAVQQNASAEQTTEASAQETAETAEAETDALQTDDPLASDLSDEDETAVLSDITLKEESDPDLESNVKRIRISGVGTGADMRLYLWNYNTDDGFSENMDEWETFLTEPLNTLTVDGMNENLLEIPVTLVDGTVSSIVLEYTENTDGDTVSDVYLSLLIPEGASVDASIDLVNNSTDADTALFIEACIVEDEGEITPVNGLSVKWKAEEEAAAVLALSLEDTDSSEKESESESELSTEESTEESDEGIMTASENSDPIDVTYLVTGEGTSHDCNMYKSDLYNEDGHWTECSICGKRYDTSSGTFVEDDSIIYEHSIVSSGSGLCGTYTISYCTECGYSVSTYIAHQPVDDGVMWTNANTYYHAIGSCSLCGNNSDGAYLIESCYDSDGNPITCTNRKVCAGCGYDYSTKVVSHHSEVTDDGITYYCEYCGKEIYKELTAWEVHDADDPLHYTFYGIFYLCDGVSFPGLSENGWTYAGMDHNTGAVTMTDATYSSLPSEYYDNSDYNTEGYTSGLYLIQYEAFIAEGYQGVIDAVRLNCDNWFSVEPSGEMPEYAKAYSMRFCNLTPDTEAPANLEASVQKSMIVSGFYTQMTLSVSCTDNYSDSVEVGIFDSEGNEIIGYCEASFDGSEFSYTFNLSSAEIEVQEEQTVYIYFKDRFGNVSKKEIILSKYDTKAPVYDENNSATSTDWTRTKTYVATATDYGVGGVLIAFNDEDDYTLADASGCVFTKEYELTGDVYGSVIAAIYYQDALGNTRTQFITIYNLDNTAPTITDVAVTVNDDTATLEATANDYSTTIGKEGSGVVSYALSTSATTMDGSWQEDNTFTVYDNGTYYIWAMDGVGLTAVSSEILVTDLAYDVSVSKTVSDASNLFGDDLSGFVFMISGTSNMGSTVEQKAVTDVSGLAEFTDVPTGNYTLKEVSTPDAADEDTVPDWWDAAEEQEIKVAYGETLLFTAENTYKTGNIQINKNAETQNASEFNVTDSYYNDSSAGFAFRLSGTGSAGETVEMYAVTGEDGTAMFQDVPVGTEYTVTELTKEEVQSAADEGNSAAELILDSVTQSLVQYVVADPFIVKSEYDSTTNYTVVNYLKLFRLTVTQMDSTLPEKGAAQDSATMEGAVYGLYHDGQLIAEYTTDAEGTFTTDYVPCGDHWYIQQITPSIGYHPNDTQYAVDASPTLFTERYNEAHLSLSAQTETPDTDSDSDTGSDPDTDPDSGVDPDTDPDSGVDPDAEPDSESNPASDPEDVIYVDPYTGSVSIKKYDGSGNSLSGVTFELTDSDGNSVITTDGTVCTNMTTDSDGSVTFSGLFPGSYQAMETDTVPGQSLLSEAFQVKLPLILTEKEASEYGKNLDLSKAVAYTSTDGSTSYYFYGLTYEVTNSATFTIPTTGGTGENAIPLLSGCTMLTIGLIILWTRKYRYLLR